ncbi:hypothetical protein HPP92_028890 [Vanilla planifolia]|uniref:Uncharacterized protein n=1 Tax=Vanilla planifolia TaxID=51239 RepID=A0A835P6V1_VANPL|nr:hypothetical protein HPP92_028890 [Vanilla planifolia]KAG0446351.1 hypothetical protein HPP92_028879 [Vanilla planifolia]
MVADMTFHQSVKVNLLLNFVQRRTKTSCFGSCDCSGKPIEKRCKQSRLCSGAHVPGFMISCFDGWLRSCCDSAILGSNCAMSSSNIALYLHSSGLLNVAVQL